MAKKKENKAPKIPAKQQMYEQILTKQLYGAPPTREEGIAKLQADYDAWNERQQGIAKLQSEYDNWLNEQKKAQQPVKAPKIETVKASVQQTPAIKMQNKVETAVPKTEVKEKKYLTHADVIPSLNKKAVEKQAQMNKVAQNKAESISKIANQLGISEDEVRQRMTAPKQELNAYNEKKIDKNTTEKYQKASSEAKRKAAQKKYNPWEAFTGRFAKATTDVVNAPLAIAGKLTGKDLSIYSDAQKQEFKDIQEQHPVASTAGDLAGMAFAAYALGGGSKGTTVPQGNVTSGQVFKALRDDAILNGAAKGRATAQALKGALPTLAGNAASNMPADFAVDIIPTLANDIAEGEKSNKQIVRDTLLNTGINAGFNAIGDIASLGKAMKNSGNPITADDAFRANALEGYEKLKKYDSIDSVVKNPLIADYADESAQSLRLTPNNKSGLKTTETAASLNGLTAGVGKSPDLITGVPTQSLESSLSDLNAPKENLNVNKNAVNFELPEETFDKIDSHFEELARPLNEVQNSGIMNNVTDEKALAEWANVNEAYSDYLDKAMFGESVEEVEAAKKALDNARKRYARAMKEIDPEVSKAFNSGSFGYKIGRPLNERNVNAVSKQGQEAVDAINELENFANTNVSKAPGADPLQFFGNGDTKGEWKTSKFRTNTMENTGWLKDENYLPTKDYAYRVFTEAEQKEAALERFKDSQNVANDLMNTDRFDEVDVKAAMNEMQRLLDDGSADSLRQARRLGEKSAHEARESGRAVQALAEYNKNSASGALNDGFSLQDENVTKWKSKNKRKAEGNSRIAKALSDMGNKWRTVKDAPELTHEQIKAGVRAELDKELGSSAQYFNDNDLEYLTMLAEDKSIPVWQITDEIEHKLNFGNWYTLDESIPEKLPTNTKLNNALNSLIEGNVRAEKPAPSLEQITNEVRNTIGKESADFAGQFSDEDIDYLANLINNGASRDELAEALNLKLSTGTFGISDQALQDINNIFKEISKFDVNSKQFVEGQAEAYRILANELNPKATALEKFDTWRYLAMLGNPKTMLRNFIGNQTFSVVTGVSNNLAALGEAGVDKAIKALGGEGIQRTKAILNPIQDAGLIKASNIDADASRYRQIIGSKYEKMDKNAIKQAKSVFDSKLLQLYEKATDAGISDYSAVKNKYSTSLAGYLKANGYDASIFDAETELARLNNKSTTQLLSKAERDMVDSLKKDVEALEKGRDFALRQAEYATFHEDNVVADLLTKWSKDARNSDSKVANAMGVMIEGTVPFKKTPANILRSGVEYSPLGAIDSIKKTGKLVYENTGKRAGNLADVYVNSKGKEVAKTLAADVIDSWAKTLTGTGLTALGMYLYNKGVIRVSDPDTRYQDQLEGIQNYSIEINGKTYTMDWSVPSAMPLFLGAEMAKVNQALGKTDSESYESIEDYMALANRLAEPMVETSMLQGVKDTLETAASTAAYDGTVSVPATLMYNMATGYATQAIPTLSGQIARTVDNTRRSTYSDKNGAAERTIDKQGKKILNKIPYLSKLNEPYVDTYGREQKNNPSDNFGINLAYQMLSPGYYSEINTTDADRLSREVYGYNKTESVLPKYQTSFKDAEGNRVSPKDFTTASKAYGKANKEIRDALAKDAWFKKLDNGSKEEIVKGINTLSEHVGKAAIDSKYSTTSKAYNTYKQGGIPGLVDYYKKENAKDVAKQTGFSSASNASKVIQKDVQNGNMKAAEQKIDAATQISNLGLDKPGPTYTYYSAQKTIPDLTPEKFVKTYKSIDSDGNQGIKQDEIINYLNNNNISESEGKKIWSAYGNSSWKSIPSLKDGKWSKSRK